MGFKLETRSAASTAKRERCEPTLQVTHYHFMRTQQQRK